MNIQYLDGIDIQLLDGTQPRGIYDGPLDARQREAVNRINGIAQLNSRRRMATVQALTRGITNSIAQRAEDIAHGVDFKGFSGNGTIADEEMLRNHLIRTKEIADQAPSMVATYQNPQTLSNMIGYVLNRWDTPEREDAIDYMIAEERKLEGLGRIDTNADEQRGELTAEAYYDADSYVYGLGAAKSTLFASLKKALKPKLTTEAQDIVAANPALSRIIAKRRNAIAQTRKAKGRVNDADVRGLNGTENSDIECLMSGIDMQYALTGENPLTSIARYIQRTKRVALTHPEYFENEEESKTIANACDILLRSWNNEQLRNAAFDSIIMACDDEKSELNGKLRKKLKKAIKKVASGVKKATKAVATTAKKAAKAVAKVAKKVGKAIAKVAKKVWKLVVRFNPLTLLIRAGILGFCRLNMFKVANKCYIGSLSKEEALKKGATADEWEKSNKAYGHLKNAYTKLGGKESKLKSTLAKGNKKKWSGTEYPTDGNAIKAAANAVNAADNKEAQADMDYDETLKEYQSKGYVSDNTVATDTATVSKQEQVTVIDNERTAKQATKLYETDATTGKVLLTVPKAAKVLVDTAQTSGNFIAATYNNKNGWITKADLAGLGACDAESVAVISMGAIYDEYSTMGLGEPATAAAIASATSVIASIMAKIKNIFGAAKTVVDKVKDVKENVIDKVKDIKAVKETIDTVKDVKNDEQSAVNAGKDLVNTTKSTAEKVQSAISTTKDAAQTAKSRVQSAVDTGKQVVSTIAKTVSPITTAAQQATQQATQTSQTQQSSVAQQQQSTTSTSTSNAQQNTAPTSSTPTQAASSGGGLSTGVKVGIGIGVLALVGLGIYALKKR